MASQSPRLKRALLGILALAVGTVIWLPTVHLVFRADVRTFYRPVGVTPRAKALAARHLRMWIDPAHRDSVLAQMRGSNAEWDFMGRTFLVLALANMSMRDGRPDPYLQVIDTIIDDTLEVEAERGMYHFLMPYARKGSFLQQPARSVFIDGEIAMMCAARRMIEDSEKYAAEHRRRVEWMTQRMRTSPTRSAESYPDECWTFCNAVALAAIRLHDYLDGGDHRALFDDWISTAKTKLADPTTGMLVSSFTLDGRALDGPEGSSIWMAAHCLELIDADFAADQYRRARRQIGRTVLGFGYAREWPASWRGPMDVDSGPIVPVLGASAGASGLAVLGAAAFGDNDYLRSLLASLELAAFPIERDGALQYAASNQVGDAVLLYAAVQGPMWRRVMEGPDP